MDAEFRGYLLRKGLKEEAISKLTVQETISLNEQYLKEKALSSGNFSKCF